MSSSSTSKSPLQGLLLLAVLGLCGWSGWLTMENQKLKQALGQSGGAGADDLAAKVATLEETIENGLVLSLIDPARGSTLISEQVGISPAEAGIDYKSAKRSPAALPDRSANAPSEESEDPNAPFDFSMDSEPGSAETTESEHIGPQENLSQAMSSSASFLEGGADNFGPSNFGPTNFVSDDFGPDHSPENQGDLGPTPAPEGSTISSREPPPSSGTFGASQNLLDGGNDPYLYELTILDVMDNGFIGLDGGNSSGVKVGALFAVIRGSREIGKVRIQELSENRSIGEIAEYVGGVSIRKGDRVVPLRN